MMNTTYRNAWVRLGPETRFGVRPAEPAPFRVRHETELERLKGRLLGERLTTTTEPELNDSLRWAANEAASLAWTTLVPALVFPELFEEKARNALLHASLQEDIRQRSRELILTE